MLKSKTDFSDVLYRVRFLYVLVFTVFTALNKFIFFQFVNASFIALTYSALAACGVVLLVIDFFTKRNMFRTSYNGIMLLFFAVYVISMIVNIRYGWVDNAKTLVWMLIQTFLLFAADIDQPLESHLKQLRIVAECFIFIWFIGTVISFGQFLVQYADVRQIPGDNNCIQGFAVGRLFGEFTDPNVASVCSMIAVVLTAFIMYQFKPRALLKVYYIITIVFNAIYIILSGSRTGMLIVAASIFASAVLLFSLKFSEMGIRRLYKSCFTVICAILCTVIVAGGMNLAKTGLSYVPKIVEPITDGVETALGLEFHKDDDSDISDQIDMTRPDIEGNSDISNARFKIWTDSLRLVEKSPVFGTSARNHLMFAQDYFGEDMYIVTRQYSVHNGYLSLLVYTGMIGTLIIACWLVLTVIKALGYLIRRRHDRDEYYMPIAFLTLIAMVIGISAFPMMGIFFGNSIIELLFWLLLGYLFCFIRKSEPNVNEPLTYRIAENIKSKLCQKNKEA